MLSTYKPKSIKVIGFDNHNYDFLKKFRSDLVISIPLIHAQEINYVLDANGNLVTGDSFYREYNELNQLIRIREGNVSTDKILEEYTWHPLEERIVTKRIFNNGVYNYTVYYPNENYVVIVNSSGTFTEKYVYQDGVLVAQVNTDGQKQAIHSDHEESNTLITDSNGNIVENTLYSPFGEILEGGKASRYGYEGKEYDPLTEKIDFKFRDYDTKIIIFGKPDDRIQNVYDPQLLNRYAFERSNPLKNIDPTGHYAWLFQLANAAIRWATNYIQNIHISIPRGKAVREATTETYHDLSEKYKEYKHEKQVKEILAISDNAAKDLEVNTEEAPPKIGEFKPVTLEDLEDKDEQVIDGKKIKKDNKLPDSNELINKINKEEEKKRDYTGNSYNSGGSSGGGGGCVEKCSISCSSVHRGGQVCFEVCNKC